MRVALIPCFASILASPLTAQSQAAWPVDPKPVLDVSSTSASGKVLFSRVTGATRLHDGTIVIADADDNALHFFDATGKLVRSAGRAGDGPGEFRLIRWLGRCGNDLVHVWDTQSRRVLVFGANGSFVRQYPLHTDSMRKYDPGLMLACSPAGVMVYQSTAVYPKNHPDPKDPLHPTAQERTLWTTAPVTVVGTSGAVTRELGDRSSGAWYKMGHGQFPLPLSPTTYVAVAGDRVYVGTSDSTSSVTGYGPDGVARTIKLAIPKRPTTPAQRAAAVAALASLAPKPLRTMAEDSLKLSPIPAVLPPFSGLFGDTDGVLWVQLSVLGDPNTRLRAVSAAGGTLGEISLPANLVVHEIGRDYVLGAYDDDSDVPHLVVYRLRRGK